MKNFLINLMVVLSLGLCILIWFQWKRETVNQQSRQTLTDRLHERDEKIQSQDGLIRTTQAEVVRLDALKKELTEQVKSNNVQIVSLDKDLDRNKAENEVKTKQLAAYKEALDRANEAIKKQNEDVARQNEELKKVADDRNELAKKYNKAVGEFNELAAKWNMLQDQLAKAATNAPPPAPKTK